MSVKRKNSQFCKWWDNNNNGLEFSWSLAPIESQIGVITTNEILADDWDFNSVFFYNYVY